MERYKFGFLIGRFQMLHKGHEHLIDSAYNQCENLLVLVGSAQERGTVRNPFDLETRLAMMRRIYRRLPHIYIGFINDLTNENDITFDWGRYLLNNVHSWAQFYNIESKLDAMFYGNDEERDGWFDPKDIEGVNQVRIDRADIPISATMMREHMIKDQIYHWQENVNQQLHPFYGGLRQMLLEVKA